ncbi:MAG: hypothetical protein IT244_01285 [Bacteroidia bacterium]|nr:hypothetical protein [Bacteroidia bacterium]
MAKAIYNNTHWDFSDNTASLALLDSLNTKNLASLPFYIKVIGLTYKKADGFYAETLGLAAKEFLENHTANFANCFSNKACFNNADLQDWAAMVIMELSLQADNTGNTSALMSYIKQIENNCKNCTSIEKETLQELVSILSKHWALR